LIQNEQIGRRTAPILNLRRFLVARGKRLLPDRIWTIFGLTLDMKVRT